MSRFDSVVEQAQSGRLYPSVILYGGDPESRRDASLQLARALLCAREEDKGCDPSDPSACTHCRRVIWPDKDAERFHPDLHVLERDLRTTTSVDATKSFAQKAMSAPFEAGSQVFVVAEAETLGAGAADALLKLLEEPPARTPRHFLLLAASRLDLLTTLRSRSLSIFLGGGERLEGEAVDTVFDAASRALDSYFSSRSALYLLTTAEALGTIDGWSDPRARLPWATAAKVLVRYAGAASLQDHERRAVLDLAQDLMDAPAMRRRGIAHTRILEGLLSKRLGGLR